jgi:DNA processing protein
MPIHRDDVKTRFQLDLLSVELPPPPPSTSDTAVHFLALKSIPGVGKATLTALYDEFRPLSSVWDEDRERLVDVLRRARNRHMENVVAEIELRASEHVSQAIEQLRRYEKARITILFRDEPNYPSQVRAVGGPPFLFVQGNPHLLDRVSTVAIVGTREPTQDGILLARQITRLLAEAGFVIVSGLAEGIDAEVHTTVLDYGGQTIAVLGNGLDVDFPASNRDLRRRILQTGGAVVTEHLPYESYSRASFVARNRGQAALSGAVIPPRPAWPRRRTHALQGSRLAGQGSTTNGFSSLVGGTLSS